MTHFSPRLLLDRLEDLDGRGAALVGSGVGGACGLGLLLLLPLAGAPLWLGAAGCGIGLIGLALFGLLGQPRLEEGPPEEPPPEPTEPYEEEDPLFGTLVVVPRGTFLMGSPATEVGRFNDESPQHPVTVSAFAMAKVPVTQAVYTQVMGENPGKPTDPKLPVNYVSWEDALRCCNRLSEQAGLRPCYSEQEDGWSWDRTADGYRLPTEAEWEYACRAGTTTAYSFGDDPAGLDEHAWWSGNSGMKLHPVATRQPNPWGLHDLHGNVWEWCWDRFGPYSLPAAGTEQIDPVGPEHGGRRVFRGGGYWHDARLVRSAYRNDVGPESRRVNVGFRCVRVPRRQP